MESCPGLLSYLGYLSSLSSSYFVGYELHAAAQQFIELLELPEFVEFI